MKKITLVGCGNIGSRHLQALVKLPFETEIQIIDPNENSIKLAKTRLNEIDYKKSNFIFSWQTSLENLQESDFVILATNSTNRVELVEKLLEELAAIRKAKGYKGSEENRLEICNSYSAE